MILNAFVRTTWNLSGVRKSQLIEHHGLYNVSHLSKVAWNDVRISSAACSREQAGFSVVALSMANCSDGSTSNKFRSEHRGQGQWSTTQQLWGLSVVHPNNWLHSLLRHVEQLVDPKSERKPTEQAPAYARNDARAIKPEYLVVIGICTHLGCSPSDKFKPAPTFVARRLGWAVSSALATVQPSTGWSCFQK